MMVRAVAWLMVLTLFLSCVPAVSATSVADASRGTAARPPATAVVNSDVEAYESNWFYYVDSMQDSFVYRETADFGDKQYLTDYSVDQIAVLDERLYMSVGQTIVQLDMKTEETLELVKAETAILRFALTDSALYYLTTGLLQVMDLKTAKTEIVMQEPELNRFWLEDFGTIAYMVDDKNIYYLDFRSSSVTVEENRKSSITDGNAPVKKGLSVASLRAKFPHGKYWNHVGGANNPDGYTNSPCRCHGNCNYYGYCDCNSFSNAIQCYGFALKLGYDYFGSDPRNWNKAYNLNNLKAGDVIRYKNDGHSIWVTEVNGDTITYADCNSTGRCQIRWGGQISRSTVASTLTHVWVAPYTITPPACTNHTKGTLKGYKVAHPHQSFYLCSNCEKEWMDEASSNYVCECTECAAQSKPKITNTSTEFVEGKGVKLQWSAILNPTYYSVWIYKYDENGLSSFGGKSWSQYDYVEYVSNGITFNLGAGEYVAFVQSYHYDAFLFGWSHEDSDPYYFTVAHDFVTVNTPPTCGAQGSVVTVCLACSFREEINYGAQTGHSYSYGVTTNPSLYAAGVLTGTCVNCFHTTTVTLPKLNDTDYTHSVSKAATCILTGTDLYKWNSTAYGNFAFTVTTLPLGHSYSSVVTAPTCTTQGYTTYTCIRCSDRYWNSYTSSTGHTYNYTNLGETHKAVCKTCSHTVTEAHNYTNGTCTCGAGKKLDPTIDQSITIQHSLNLASDISMNYAVKTSLLDDYDSFYLDVQVPIYEGNVLTGSKSVTIEPVLNGEYYYFTMAGLTAVNMNDMLVATLHMNQNRQEYLSKPDNYSIATYALTALNRSSTDEGLKVLCANLLRYGAMAQIYKSYRTDALATMGMTETHKSYLSDLNAVTFGNIDTLYNDLPNPIIRWAGKTLTLNSKVTVRFVFYADAYVGDISQLTLRMAYPGADGQYRRVTLSNPVIYNEAQQMYAFDFSGLTAAELRSPISVAVYNGDTPLSQTLRFSPDTYGNATTGALRNLCQALFAYSDSAKAYFAQ